MKTDYEEAKNLSAEEDFHILSKEEACNKYLYKVKPKHLSDFEAKTPKGNKISGYICKKPNHFLGSLVITSLNGKRHEQFVQSFPKIHYQDNDRIKLSFEKKKEYFAHEKLDGSNIILYPLKGENGEIIEIIPKSRNMPVCDDHLLDAFNEWVDKYPIEMFLMDNPNSTIMFEMYGTRNQHEIVYPSVYLDTALIGIYDGNGFMDDDGLDNIAKRYGFKRPNKIFSIKFENNQYRFDYLDNPLRLYMEKVHEDLYYPTSYDCIESLKDELALINGEYERLNKRIALEGVVINGYDSNGYHIYIKVKQNDLREKSWSNKGITRRIILKEVRKYFDEYGSQVKEIYQQDKKHYLDYVQEQLKEEFDEYEVMSRKTRSKIESVFFDFWDSRTIPQSLQEICEEIVVKNPGRSTGELMSIFAKEHPEKKKLSRSVYSHMDAVNRKFNQ